MIEQWTLSLKFLGEYTPVTTALESGSENNGDK